MNVTEIRRPAYMERITTSELLSFTVRHNEILSFSA